MADNAVRYGFRAVRSRYSSGDYEVQEAFVATAAAFNVNGGASGVVLGEGDPLVQLSDGSVTLAVGSETTDSTTILGICVGIKQYYDTVKGVMTALGPGVPSGLAWGTNLARQTKILYVPIEAAVWAIQVNDNTTATTEAAYQAFIGENCRMVLTGATGTNRAAPKLNISTHATTNTFPFKIVDLGKTAQNQDYSGNNVELLVISNGTIASRNAILGI